MSRNDRMAEVARRYVDNRRFAGIEWQVEAQGAVLSAGQAGYADADRRTRIPKDALYRIYSMTKPVISVLALALVEQGRLRLYDMLPQYDPRFARMRVVHPDGSVVPAARPITVEDLITHRAGFTYEFITGCHIAPFYQRAQISSDGAISLDEMMGRLAQQPLAFQPGSQFRYSVATDALAHVCERATGRGVDDLLREYLFDPLGMRHTTYCVAKKAAGRIMPMYGISDISALSPLVPHTHELVRADVDGMYPAHDPGFRRGGHGLFSTLGDYLKFARMLLDGKAADGTVVLSRKMVEMMRCNRIPPEQMPLRIGLQVLGGYGWGLGVRVMVDPGQANALTGSGELGWAGAASTYFWVDPREAMVGVVMTQYLGAMLPLTDDMRVAAYQMLP